MSLQKLQELSESINIAESLTEDEQRIISEKVLEGYENDRNSMLPWLDSAAEIMDLIKLEGNESKTFPFPGASNIKYPLITLANIQFSSRTMPEVIKNNEAVKYQVIGREDPNGLKVRKGQRMAKFMNYKLLLESDTWVEGRDALLHQLAALGTVFTKTYFDPIKLRVESKLIPYNEIIVNNNITSLEDAPRISHLVEISVNDIHTGVRRGYYSEIPSEVLEGGEEIGWENMPEFIEQHCWHDLDDDGYEEPYMVIVHAKSGKILRIRANYQLENIEVNEQGEVVRISPQQFFVAYRFLMPPDGTFFGYGFGTLLRSTNSTINTGLNQLMDSGKLANTRGGFVRDNLRMNKQEVRMKPGEWKGIKVPMNQSIRDSFFPLEYKEPSTVLFSLIEYMVNSSKELTSSTEALTGTMDGQNTSPATLINLIKEGMRIFTAIQRRVNRGLQQEYKLILRHLVRFTSAEEYQRVLDLTEQEQQEVFDRDGNILDFDLEVVDVSPISDFSASTEAVRVAQSKGLQEMVAMFPAQTNTTEVMRFILEALEVPNPDKFINAEPAPNPDAMVKQAETQLKEMDLQLKAQKNEIDALKAMAQVEKDRTQALKNIAEAEAAEAGPQLEVYKSQLDSLTKEKIANGKSAGAPNNSSGTS